MSLGINKFVADDLCLCGDSVSLEPLSIEHAEPLLQAASDGELWNLRFTGVPNASSVLDYVNDAIESRTLGQQHPFIVRQLAGRESKKGKIVGCTRYYDIEAQHRNLAIGYTWYAKSAQRTAVNTETKLLLLSYAFEQLKCISVAFHTDNLNVISQAAIKRLGAKHEGVLRNHRIMPDGRIRDTWCYSIIDNEWPALKKNLASRLK